MAQTTITLSLKGEDQTFPISIGNQLLSTLGTQMCSRFPKSQKIMLVTETNVQKHYADIVDQQLKKADFEVTVCVLPGGEAAKSPESLHQLYDALLQNQFTRHDIVLALGGGIIGDIAGFAAATYRRGIQFIQVPTTLLAQVDASVGGKVAINYGQYKNMIGAFYQPHWVCIDPDVLATLPEREFACGMAEVIKYAIIQDSVPHGNTLPSLLKRLSDEPAFNAANIGEIIEHCCQLKAWVVEADAKETLGIRELLNLGHTFGHALETLSEHQILHGEAVAIGMVYATQLAVNKNQLSSDALTTLYTLLKKYNLPLETSSQYPPKAILEAMKQDKKRQNSQTHRLIVPKNTLGQVTVSEDFTDQDLLELLS